MRRSLVLVIAGLACLPIRSEIAEAQVNTQELLQILKIHTWRIRVPAGEHQVWDIGALKKTQLHATGRRPIGLTASASHLLAFRELEGNKIEFTLTELKGFSQGVQDLCDLGADCKGQYELHWKTVPSYSADAEQCVLGELTNSLKDDQEELFVVLVRIKNVPE